MDLAARNCLLHTNNAVKIGDFGLTRPFDEGNDYWLMRETLKLAVKWIPPDALKTKRFGEPSDVWAFGVCLWEIYSMGANPFHDVCIRKYYCVLFMHRLLLVAGSPPPFFFSVKFILSLEFNIVVDCMLSISFYPLTRTTFSFFFLV